MLAPTEAITAADCLLAMHMLNREVKHLDNKALRQLIYGLKTRLCRVLCAQGYCVGAIVEAPANADSEWYVRFTFAVDGTVYHFHQPRSHINWPFEECEPTVESRGYTATRRLTPRECGNAVNTVCAWLESAERE